MVAVLPLVLLTLFTQLAAGMALFLAWRAFREGGRSGYPTVSFWGAWLYVAGAAVLGLAASMFYRQPALTGMAPPEPVWMSLPGLLVFLCAALAFLTWQRRGDSRLGGLAALAGVAGVALQSLAYTPGGVTSLSGLLPLSLFGLSALMLGGSFAQQAWKESFAGIDTVTKLLRCALALMLLILALVPSLGAAAGDIIMQTTALAWMSTQIYWAAVMATGVALGLSFMGRGTASIQFALVVVAVLASRWAFFTDGVHLAANVSLSL